MASNHYYLSGNTVKFEAVFHDFDNSTQVMIPEEARITFYDSLWNQIDSFLVTESGSGSFEYFYAFDEVGTYFYEWSGLFGGMKSLYRKKVIIKRIGGS